LLQRHGSYVHGSPYQDGRKVVLNKDIYEKIQASEAPFTFIPPHQLFLKFKLKLKECCVAAKAAGGRLLVLMCGHGLSESGHFYFGQGIVQELKPEKFLKQMDLTGDNQGLPVMLISTACYSGGWVASPDFNISGMAAAGEKRPSLSWRYSGSLGRACGTMFVSGIAEKLTNGFDPEDLETEEQNETYIELIRSTYQSILNIDRRAWQHEFTFKSQDDEWGQNWQLKTGISVHQRDRQLATLQTIPKDPTLHPGDFLNRDESVPDYLRREFLDFWEKFKNDKSHHVKKGDNWIPLRVFPNHPTIQGSDGKQRYFDSQPAEAQGSMSTKRSHDEMQNEFDVKSLRRWVKMAGAFYFDSHPGPSEESPNGAVHSIIGQVMCGELKGVADVQRAYQRLKYRLEIMAMANYYVSQLDIGLPEGKTCHEFDYNNFYNTLRNDQVGKSRWQEIEKYWHKTASGKLFPRAPGGQVGMQYSKVSQYLIAALYYTKVDTKECRARIEKLKAIVDGRILGMKEQVKNDPEIRTKRQKFAESIGKKIRDWSPVRSRENAPPLPSSSGPSQSQFGSLTSFQNYPRIPAPPPGFQFSQYSPTPAQQARQQSGQVSTPPRPPPDTADSFGGRGLREPPFSTSGNRGQGRGNGRGRGRGGSPGSSEGCR
jgi:hypothetical protein